MGKQHGAANIGHKSDPAFRHRDLRAFAHDAVRRVTANTNTAAHCEALKEGDNRFGIVCDLRIQPIFIAPEVLTVGEITCAPRAIQIRDVATRAKGFLTSGINHNKRHAGILCPSCNARSMARTMS